MDALALSPLVGPSGRIYSIEAHPWTFRALLKMCELNDLANVVPLHYALSDRAGQFWISDLSNTEENSISDIRTHTHTIAVSAITLNSLIETQGIDRIALLKMNIEGAEAMAINGIAKHIDLVDHVAIACHDFIGDGFLTRQVVRDFLQRHGFEVIERRNDPRPYVRDHIHGIRKNNSKLR